MICAILSLGSADLSVAGKGDLNRGGARLGRGEAPASVGCVDGLT